MKRPFPFLKLEIFRTFKRIIFFRVTFMLCYCKLNHLVPLLRLNSKCSFLMRKEVQVLVLLTLLSLLDLASKSDLSNPVINKDPKYSNLYHCILFLIYIICKLMQFIRIYIFNHSFLLLFLLKNHVRGKFQQKYLKRKKYHLLKVCNWNYLNRPHHQHHDHGLLGKDVWIMNLIQ